MFVFKKKNLISRQIQESEYGYFFLTHVTNLKFLYCQIENCYMD